MALLNENLALIVKVMCGRNHLDISILLISQEITGSPPDDEIRSAIHKVALSLYHLVSKRKYKNKSLEWILTKEKDFLESISFEAPAYQEAVEGHVHPEEAKEEKRSRKRENFDECVKEQSTGE